MATQQQPRPESPAAPASSEYRYWAFISYSQRDEDWARWLHRGLETYAIPKKLAGTEGANGLIPRRLFPVFRDRDEIGPSDSLGETLKTALEQSRNLIIVCSPHSARSRWVNEEVKLYKGLGRANRVFGLIVAGEPNTSDDPARSADECFVGTLRFHVDPDGTVTSQRVEPVAADARENKDGKRNALLKIISSLIGVRFDSLKQRDQERRIRRMAVAGGIMAVLVVLFAGLAFYANLQRVSAEERRRLALARQLATQSEAVLAREDDGSLELSTLLALESIRSAWTPEAHHLLLRQGTLLPSPALRTWQTEGIHALSTVPKLDWLISSSDNEDAVWNLKDGSLVHRIKATKSGSRLPAAGSADGRWVVTQCDATLCVHATTGGDWPEVFRVPATEQAIVIGAKFSPDGELLAVGNLGSTRVELYRTGGWKPLASIDHGEDVRDFAFRPGRSQLAVIGDSRLTIWDVPNRVLLGEHQVQGGSELAFSPDGERLAVGRPTSKMDGSLTMRPTGIEISLWDVNPVEQGGVQLTAHPPELHAQARSSSFGYFGTLTFSRSGKYLATTGSVFDVASGTEITRTIPNDQTAVAFGIDDRDLVVANDEGLMEVRPVDAKEAVRLTGVPAARAVDFSPSGGYLAIGGSEGDVQIIDVNGWRNVAEFDHEEPIASVVFSADGRWLAVIGKHIAVSHDTRGWAVRTRVAHEDEIKASGFSPDSRYLVTSTTRVLALSPLQEGGAPRILEHDGTLEPLLQFSPQSVQLRSRTQPEFNRRDGLTKPAALRVWESGSGRLLQTIEPRDEAEGSEENSAADKGWQSVTLEARPRVAPEKGPWPTPTTLQGADLLEEQLKQASRAHGASLTDHAVSPDGTWVATAAGDPTVRVWTLVPETLMRQTCARITRPLSEKEWAEFQVADEPNRPTCTGKD